MKIWKLNSSNPGKVEEFKRLFGKHGYTLEITHFDLKEIDSDPAKVIAHKASQLGENILVEDTSLEIEGASVGINIRWVLEHLNEYAGRRAEWLTLLAYHQGDHVNIYKGSIGGTIVIPRGDGGFGFDPVFLPDGAASTLAESKSDVVNARAKAVESLLKEELWMVHPLIKNWVGLWQNNSMSKHKT